MSEKIYEMVSLPEVLKRINPEAPLAFDTETIGKYGKIRLAQFFQPHWQKALLVNYPQPLQLLQLLLSIPDTNIVMQYAAYDISTIQAQTQTRFIPKTFNDTFLSARLAFPYLDSFSLDSLITEVLSYDPYAEAGLDKKALQNSDWDRLMLDPEQLHYAAIDVYYLFYLYERVKPHEQDLSYKVDMRALRRALDFQNNGMPVDRDALIYQYVTNNQKIREINLPINANSYKQVRPFIGSEDSDDLGLAKLALLGNDKAQAVRTVRKLLKQNSFIDKFDTESGRIYGRFAPSARSGRFTCSDQNLQQLPRKLKGCFGVEDDKVLIFSDYPQLELRTIASDTGDPVLCDLLRNRKDPHNYVAAMTFGENFTKDDRQVTKTENFNLLYAGGAGMLQSILLKDADRWIEIEEIRTLIRKWKRIFKGIVMWQEQGIADYNKGRLWQTPFGRKYIGRLMTDHLNIRNQGFGADVAKLALHYMYDDLLALDCVICNFIHDSYIGEMPNDETLYLQAAKVMGTAMKDAWSEATKMVKVQDIPMPVEVSVGFNWGDIEKGNTVFKGVY